MKRQEQETRKREKEEERQKKRLTNNFPRNSRKRISQTVETVESNEARTKGNGVGSENPASRAIS